MSTGDALEVMSTGEAKVIFTLDASAYVNDDGSDCANVMAKHCERVAASSARVLASCEAACGGVVERKRVLLHLR